MCRGAAVIVREQDNVARSLSGSDTTSLDRRYNSTAGHQSDLITNTTIRDDNPILRTQHDFMLI